MNIELSALVPPVHAIAQRAAQTILAVYRGAFTIEEKADHTPVTTADLAAHNVIVPALRALTPQVPVLSEESIHISCAERIAWNRLWLVDPLDGTREFIARSDQFSINIALIEDHAPIFGLIMIPVSGVTYFAWRGGGAWKHVPQSPPRRIACQPLGDGPVRVIGSRTHTTHPLQTYLEHLGKHDYLGVGSALKACLIAEGQADLYARFGPTSEWDTAASQILLEEAGGGLTDVALLPLRYNARPTLGNPDFFAFGDPRHDWTRYLPRRKPRV